MKRSGSLIPLSTAIDEKFATQRGFQLFIAVKLIRFNRRTGSVKSPLKKFSIERV